MNQNIRLGLDAQYDKNGKLISRQVEPGRTCGNCLFYHFFTDTCRRKAPCNSVDDWPKVKSTFSCDKWIRRV